MKTFLYKSLTCLLALSLALGAPARVFAAAVSDEKIVSLSDGSKAFLFKVSGYSDAKEGDLYVVVTEGKTRTVYRPAADPLADPDFSTYQGVVLPSGSNATKFEVVGVKAAGALPAAVKEALTGSWRLIDEALGQGSVKLDAAGSPDKGYTLKGTVTLDGVGALDVDGTWSAANESAPLVLKVDNAAKALFEKSLGKAVPKDWLKLGDKVTVTLGLDPEWVKDLKRGSKEAPAPGKSATPKKFSVEAAVPLTLKFDPTQPAFALTARIDPIAKTTKLSLDAGQKWVDPFGYLPVTFSQVDLKSDLSFETLTMSAAGDMTFFKSVPIKLEAAIKGGKVTSYKLTATPPADFLSAALKAAPVPDSLGVTADELKWALDEVLKNIKLGSLTISAPDFLATLADVGLKFSVVMPNWKYDFDISIPGVSLKNLDKIASVIADKVFPVIVENLDKITAGLIFKGVSGKWLLGLLDLGLASAKLWAEGDATKGYTLTGIVTVKEAGDFTVNGFWSPSTPLEPIVFKADNILKTSLEKSLSQMVAKDALTLGDKVTVKVGVPPSWVERMKRSGRAAPKAAAGAAKEEFTLEASMPFTAKIDPKKPAFKFTAKSQPIKKTLSVAFDDGQSWDKPLDVLPVKFDKLTVTTDTGLTSLSVAAAGKLDFLVSCDATVTAASKNGAAVSYTAVLKPAAGTNIVKAILNGRVPSGSQPLVDALLPNTVVEEISAAMDAKKSKPDVRLKFTMSKGTVTQKFDVLVKDADMAKPDDYAAKAAPQIVDQLTGGVTGDALAKLGLKGKFTVVDLDLDVLKMKVVAEGDPKDKYTLAGDFKIPLVGKFDTVGAWYPSKPTEPVVFETQNIFKPIIDEMLSGSLSSEQFELKDKMMVTIALSEGAVSALKGGGSTPPAKAQGGSGGTFTLDIGFPMKLKIDPTKKAFDMTGRVYPFDQTASLELDPGVTWDKPFGIFPMTFSSLVAGTDPSFTTLTIDAGGRGTFLGDMEFAIAATLRKGQKGTLRISAVPSGDMVAAILKQVKVPANFLMPEIKLEKFNVKADLAQLQAGKLPSARLKFSLKTAATKAVQMRAVSVDIDVPSVNFTEPDKFAKVVGEELLKTAQSLAVDVTDAVIDGAKETVKDAATDPVGTSKKAAESGKDAAVELGKGVWEFAKDPGKGAEDLAKGAADLAETLGETAYDLVSNEVEKFASDPVGTLEEKGKAALAKAEAAFNAVSGFLSDIGGFVTEIFSRESFKEKRGKREIKKLKDLGAKVQAAKTVADLNAIISETDRDVDLCWWDDGKKYCGHRTAAFRDIVFGLVDDFNKATLEGLRARAERAVTTDELLTVYDDLKADSALCSKSGTGYTCTSPACTLWADMDKMWDKIVEKQKELAAKKEQAILALVDKVRAAAETAGSTDEVDSILKVVKENTTLCTVASDGGITCATPVVALWTELKVVKKLLALRKKIFEAADGAKLDAVEAEVKAIQAESSWPTYATHLAGATKAVSSQREVLKLYESLQAYVKKAVSWSDYAAIQKALEGAPPAGFVDLKRLADGAPAGPVRDLVGKVKGRVDKAEADRRAVSDYIISAGPVDIGDIRSWLDGKSKSLMWLKKQEKAMPWSSAATDVLGPADITALKAELESRGKVAWAESLDGKLTDTWDEDYLKKVKDHLSGKPAADFPDVSAVPADQKASIISQVDDQLARLGVKRNETVKSLRTLIKARESEKDLKNLKEFLTANLTKNQRGPEVYFDASPLTRAQKEDFIKEVEERLTEVPKFQEAQMAKIRESIAAAVRRRDLSHLDDYLGGTRFDGMPRYDALTADQVAALRKEVKKRDDELKVSLPKEQEAAIKAFYPQAPTIKIGQLSVVLNSLAIYGYIRWPFDDLPDTEELSKAQVTALAKEVTDFLDKVIRQAASNYIARQMDAQALVSLKTYVESLTSGALLTAEQEEIAKNLGFSDSRYLAQLSQPALDGIATEIGGRIDALGKSGSVDDFRKLIQNAKDSAGLGSLMSYLKTGQADAKLGFPPMSKLTGPEIQTLTNEIKAKLDAPAGGAASAGTQTALQKFEKLIADSKEPAYLAALLSHLQSGGKAQVAGFTFQATTGLAQADIGTLSTKINDRLTALKPAAAPTLSDAEVATAIKNLYTSILGREADAGGLDWYKKQYPKIGTPGIAKELFNSDDFKKRARRDQISTLYATILGRAADDGGLTWYAGTTKSIRTIADEMLAGDEFKKRPAADQEYVKNIKLLEVLQ